MRKKITNYWFLIGALFIMSLMSNAQTPGTIPSGWGNGGGNPPSATGLGSIYSATGHYTLSADGIGSLSSSMQIRVNKPNAGATVSKAILMSALNFNATIANGCCTLAGTSVNWNGSVAGSFLSGFFHNYWADVTSIVATAVDPLGAGIANLTLTECNSGNQDGEALIVVFNDASAPERTIVIMWGAENPSGDNFAITLGTPIDPLASGAKLDMGLGIGFSAEAGGIQQYSQIDVNGTRLTTSAGGEDDGSTANGALLTVGGIGDANTNPGNPNATPVNQFSDDELYSLLPFITNTTTTINANTLNPSNDDNIFLAYFVISGAAIIGEGILLSQTTSSGPVGGNHTVQALVQNTSAAPIPGRTVTFTVIAGPNSGASGTAVTDGSGLAFFTYPDNGGPGTDQIQGCFVNSQSATQCSNILFFTWITQTSESIPTMSEWGLIILGFVLLVVGSVYIMRRRGFGIS
jgi:hypothetical protein